MSEDGKTVVAFDNTGGNRAKLHASYLLPVMIPKKELIVGAYYVGLSRNTTVARWTGSEFKHWRVKWGNEFIETIKHPEDDDVFDCFVPVARSNGHDVRLIPFEETT